MKEALLQKISEVLKIPMKTFQNFDKEALNIIANTFHKGAVANNSGYINCRFNPIDKIIKLHDEKIALYERMLKEKDEMMARFEKLIRYYRSLRNFSGFGFKMATLVFIIWV